MSAACEVAVIASDGGMLVDYYTSAMLRLSLCVIATQADPAITLNCSDAQPTTLRVSWPSLALTDLYYVSLSETPTSRPFALQTSAEPSVVIYDLIPDTSYYITLRSHPASFPSIVWGWREAETHGKPTKCTTKGADYSRPHSLKRIGDRPSTKSISVTWNAGENSISTPRRHSVGIRLAETKEWLKWEAAASNSAETSLSHTISGLLPGKGWEVVVRDDSSGAVSDAMFMRTSAPGSLHTTAYRIAEFVFEPDFLGNHDTADVGGMPVYIQNGGAKNETTLEQETNHTLDECVAAMTAACPMDRGTSFHCMQCADAHREAVETACGKFSDGDEQEGWVVHFYCGIGWPESTWQRSPMNEYCVEHLPAPQTDPIPGGEGYAQYISCNSDECDGALLPTGNTPHDPTCICWVWDDRMIAQEPRNHTLRDCSESVKLPWANGNQCNCTPGAAGVAATHLQPDSPMANYVGRSRVFLPYYHYDQPMDAYPISVPIGHNIAFPKQGECAESAELGDEGCTWKRLPSSPMLYGSDLVAHGWNATDHNNLPTIEDEMELSYQNMAVFKQTLARNRHLMSPRCCGC